MHPIVPGVVLAAGRSSRMGFPKALLPCDDSGETFVTRIVRELRGGGADDVVVVTGAHDAAIADALAAIDPPPRRVVNPDPEGAQLSSLLLGLGTVDRPGVTGMLLTLVDLPLVRQSTVERLLTVHRMTRAAIIRPVRGRSHGHPVIFDRAVFGELRRADATLGAKAVVRAHAADIVDVPIDDDGPFADIDTPEDYTRAFRRAVPERVRLGESVDPAQGSA